jgi:hypothetical protein
MPTALLFQAANALGQLRYATRKRRRSILHNMPPAKRAKHQSTRAIYVYLALLAQITWMTRFGQPETCDATGKQLNQGRLCALVVANKHCSCQNGHRRHQQEN